MAGTARARGTGPGPGLTVLLLVGAAAACLAAVLAAGVLGPVVVSPDSPADRLVLAGREREPAAPAEEAAVVEVEPVRPVDPDAGIPLEVVLSMAVVVVAGALLARSLLGARRGEVAEDPDDEAAEDDGGPGDRTGALVDVALAARRALDRLDVAGPGGRDGAVLACWVALEEAGGRLGNARAHTDTPTDFADRLLAAAPGLDPAVLDDLRRTYSRVRFGRDGAGPADVDRAREALRHLLGVLDPAGRQVRR